MTYRIEETDRKLREYWRGFLVALCIGVGLLAVRALFYYAFSAHDLNSQPIGVVVLIATIVALIIAFYFLVRLGRLKAKINSDPQLREALAEEELTLLRATESWKIAFIGAVATPWVFLIISTFSPFCDILTIALSTSIVGSAAYLIAFYRKSGA